MRILKQTTLWLAVCLLHIAPALPYRLVHFNPGVSHQEKRIFPTSKGVYADNRFDGARLTRFTLADDGAFEAYIAPENKPINHSTWYAFRLWADKEQDVTVRLIYDVHLHRYPPKISTDGKYWTALTDDKIKVGRNAKKATLSLHLNATDTLWVAAQEVISSKAVKSWIDQIAAHPAVRLVSVGKSKHGRDLWMLDIGAGKPTYKETVVVMGRQHPPEVTGYKCMQAFLEHLLRDTEDNRRFLAQYRLLVIPMVNPDGVDMGHWRHNANGVDLNRDWGEFWQPETALVSQAIVNKAQGDSSQVILGLDFHSTFEDIYYTNHRYRQSFIPTFKRQWLKSIAYYIPNYTMTEDSAAEYRSVSKNWFFNQFGADAITYEIGDRTPNDLIMLKGQVSAREMVRLLLKRPHGKTFIDVAERLKVLPPKVLSIHH